VNDKTPRILTVSHLSSPADLLNLALLRLIRRWIASVRVVRFLPQENTKERNMRSIAKKTITIGFACVIGLLLTGVTVRAQDPEPVPTIVPIPTGTVTNTYAAKFICGVQPDASIKSAPDAQAGHYSTKINVHNNTGISIRFRKKVIQLKGGQVPIAPQFRTFEALQSDWAMEVVCRDIYRHLNIPIPPVVDVIPPYIEGFVIFEVFFANPLPISIPFDPLDVEGIYTYRAEPVGTDAVAIDVEVFPTKSNRYVIPLIDVAGDPVIVNSAPVKRQ
jgi:hypothetical protein